MFAPMWNHIDAVTTFSPIIEEILKIIPIFICTFVMHPSRQDLIERSIAIGVGFAILENAFYKKTDNLPVYSKNDNGKIIAIFKAHTKSRVKFFYKEFAQTLDLADKCYVMDIGEDRKEVGYDDVSCYDIINHCKNAEHIAFDEADKLLQYENISPIFVTFLVSKFDKSISIKL